MRRDATPTTTGRRERNKAEKRARILDAAQRLLATQGYERMTMAQVASEADVAIGTVFQYATTKPELLMMAAADRWSELITSVIGASVSSESAVDDIRRLLRPLLDSARADSGNAMAIARELLFGAPGPHRSAMIDLVADLESAVANVLVSSGRGTGASAAARLIVSGALLELNRTRTGRASESSIEARLDDLIEIVVRGQASH